MSGDVLCAGCSRPLTAEELDHQSFLMDAVEVPSCFDCLDAGEAS